MKAPKPGTVRLFDALVPPLVPGRYALSASLKITTTKGQGDPLDVIAEGPKGAAAAGTVDVTAPRFRLDSSEIAATYPADGAPEAPDNMLPHVMLRRRTLPWERPVEPTRTAPWMAVLLFWPGEATFFDEPFASTGRALGGSSTGETDAASTKCHLVEVSRKTLHALLPKRSELALLCHARQLDVHETATHRDDDGFVAYVVGSRLPQQIAAENVASQPSQSACLVSLEGIYDDEGLWPEDTLVRADETIRLVVLHKWSFKVGVGGDFQEHWNQLGKAGGSKMFGEDLGPDGSPLANPLGQVALSAPLATAAGPEQDPRTVLYAGPCVGVPLDHDKHFVRHASEALAVAPDGREVVSHAAAFELGRLLALASPASLTQLLSYRHDQLGAVPVLPDDTLDPAIVALKKQLNARFIDVLRGYKKGGGLGGIPGFPGDPDPGWPDRLGADPTGVGHLVGQVAGLTPAHLTLPADQTRTRIVLGERWDEGAQASFTLQALAGLDLAAADLGATLDAVFSQNAVLAARGSSR